MALRPVYFRSDSEWNELIICGFAERPSFEADQEVLVGTGDWCDILSNERSGWFVVDEIRRLGDSWELALWPQEESSSSMSDTDTARVFGETTSQSSGSSRGQPIVPSSITLDRRVLTAEFAQDPGVRVGGSVRIAWDGQIDMEPLWTLGLMPIGSFIVDGIELLTDSGREGVARSGEVGTWVVTLRSDPNATPSPEDFRRQTGRQQWLMNSLVERYSRPGCQNLHLVRDADLWDELAEAVPKANERRRAIQRILEARRDLIQEEERQQRIQEMEAAEKIREAEEVLRKAAKRAAQSGSFEKPRRKLRLD